MENIQNPPSPGKDGPPVPRDLPDQQATDEPDPWDLEEGAGESDAERESEGTSRQGGGDGREADGRDVPETDEAGTGRAGQGEAPRSRPASGSDDPEPEEPTA
ncbi:hypothetical protein [Streptomyces sp. CC224B]|uniref:hypothetical protein n=1 Tax=Streptomyces sp. CC224B TaxID=3044571 RepID=UPI0024A95448|nr:hypothetical protein [Streptomyces sp. CC224B]